MQQNDPMETEPTSEKGLNSDKIEGGENELSQLPDGIYFTCKKELSQQSKTPPRLILEISPSNPNRTNLFIEVIFDDDPGELPGGWEKEEIEKIGDYLERTREYKIRHELNSIQESAAILAQFWECKPEEIVSNTELPEGLPTFNEGDYIINISDGGRDYKITHDFYIVYKPNNLTMALKGIHDPATIRWTQAPHNIKAAERCVSENIVQGKKEWGSSGIAERNSIVLTPHTVDLENKSMFLMQCRSDEGFPMGHLRFAWKTIEYPACSKQPIDSCRKIQKEEYEAAATQDWEKLLEDSDVAEVHEFNKRYASGFTPKGYAVIWTRTTTRGNTTAVIGRIKEQMRCPDELKGRVIGKGGEIIKRLAEKHNIRRIKLI